MITTDDVPIRIGFSDYRPEGQGSLEQWLAKEAAEGGVQPESNEAAGTAAYSDLYTDPPARKDVSNVDGHWGKKETGKPIDPGHNNRGTFTASQMERHAVAEHALNSMPSAEANAQAVLSANFDNARSGNFTAHSLLLQGKTKEGSAPSMSERVRRIINQF
jgi:hypothetical protein